jgi:hypothetical protein
MREPLTMAGYLGGRMIREPLCLYDMDVPVDGADAFIVTTAERARAMPALPVLVHAASMGMTAPPEEHLAASLDATGQPLAARDLRAKSDLWLDDIDLFWMTDGIAGVTARNPVQSGPEGFDPRDPANASGLVVYLASDSSAWLTGQVFRVDGSRVQPLRGWSARGEFRSESGTAVGPEELIPGLPQVYGTAPLGRLPAGHGAG